MPRFFIDIPSDFGSAYDEEGHDFPDLAAARAEARMALIDLFKHVLDTQSTELVAEIRGGNRILARETLSVNISWFEYDDQPSKVYSHHLH